MSPSLRSLCPDVALMSYWKMLNTWKVFARSQVFLVKHKLQNDLSQIHFDSAFILTLCIHICKDRICKFMSPGSECSQCFCGQWIDVVLIWHLYLARCSWVKDGTNVEKRSWTWMYVNPGIIRNVIRCLHRADLRPKFGILHSCYWFLSLCACLCCYWWELT